MKYQLTLFLPFLPPSPTPPLPSSSSSPLLLHLLTAEWQLICFIQLFKYYRTRPLSGSVCLSVRLYVCICVTLPLLVPIYTHNFKFSTLTYRESQSRCSFNHIFYLYYPIGPRIWTSLIRLNAYVIIFIISTIVQTNTCQ